MVQFNDVDNLTFPGFLEQDVIDSILEEEVKTKVVVTNVDGVSGTVVRPGIRIPGGPPANARFEDIDDTGIVFPLYALPEHSQAVMERDANPNFEFETVYNNRILGFTDGHDLFHMVDHEDVRDFLDTVRYESDFVAFVTYFEPESLDDCNCDDYHTDAVVFRVDSAYIRELEKLVSEIDSE